LKYTALREPNATRLILSILLFTPSSEPVEIGVATLTTRSDVPADDLDGTFSLIIVGRLQNHTACGI